jgi:hypothetical protein
MLCPLKNKTNFSRKELASIANNPDILHMTALARRRMPTPTTGEAKKEMTRRGRNGLQKIPMLTSEH